MADFTWLFLEGPPERTMKRTWTIIGVNNVRASFKWYQSLFGQRETAPAHDEFGQLLDSDGTVLLCLHEWGAHGHPTLMSPDHAIPGNGLLLFFRVDDFDLALQRARGLCLPTRRGASREPEYANEGVLGSRSRRILRHDECALAWTRIRGLRAAQAGEPLRTAKWFRNKAEGSRLNI